MDIGKLSTADLKQMHAGIKSEIRRRQRGERQSAERVPSPRELAAVAEHERRTAAGEAVDPLVGTVDLERLATSEIYERVLDIDDTLSVNEAVVRGVPLRFFTPNLRALWQSYGPEYIEPELLDFIDGMDGQSVFFDIGASTGVFAIYAAAKGIQTYCFEPEVANFNILNTNAFLNFGKAGEFFHAFNIAVSDRRHTDSLFVRKFEAAAHEKILSSADARDGSKAFAYEYRQRVLCQPLDDFCNLEGVVPTDLKIDVDGAETAVVEGMRTVLRSDALRRIFIEIAEAEPASRAALAKILDCEFRIKSRNRVQNYFGEFNYILVRD